MAKKIEKLSTFVSRFIPQHLQESNPRFVDFTTGFIKFLESTNGPYDVISKLLLDENIADTLSLYRTSLQDKYAPFLPTRSVADEANVFKQIRNFYKSKGTEDSFKWLFRAYYDSELTFYYPKVDILRCSDGKWYNPLILHVEDGAGNKLPNLSDFIGNKIIGSVSGDSGIIDGVVEEYEAASGLIIPALAIVSSSSQFVQGETLIIANPNISQVIKVLPTAGAIVHRDGIWQGTDGQISSNKRIQDNNYYQDLSYQLNVGVSSDTFRLMVKHAIHPAGRKMFAIVEMINIRAKKAGAVNITDTVGIEWNRTNVTNILVGGIENGFGFVDWILDDASVIDSLIEKTVVSQTNIVAATSLNSTVSNTSSISTKWNSDTYFFGNDVGNVHTFNLHDPSTVAPIVVPHVIGGAITANPVYSSGTINNTFSSDTLNSANTFTTFGGVTNQPNSVYSVNHNVGQAGFVTNTWSNGTINNTFSSDTNLLSTGLMTFGGGAFTPAVIDLISKATFNTGQMATGLLIQAAQSDRFNSSTVSMNDITWTFGDTGLQTTFTNLNNVLASPPAPTGTLVTGIINNTFASDTLGLSNSFTTIGGGTNQPNSVTSQSTNNGSVVSGTGTLSQNPQQYGFNSGTSTFRAGQISFNSNIR